MRMSPVCTQLPSSSAPSPTSGILAGFAAGGGGDTATGAALLPHHCLPARFGESGDQTLQFDVCNCSGSRWLSACCPARA